MSDSAAPVAVSVEQLLGASIEGFLAAALMHLGEPVGDAEKLQAPDPQEAWRALLAADALMAAAAPLIDERFKRLLAMAAEALAARHPDLQLPLPASLEA